MNLVFRGSIVDSVATATSPNWSVQDRDSFTVCLLAIDKDERDYFKMIAFHALTAKEDLITEVPYREDCCIACLKGNDISKAIMLLC